MFKSFTVRRAACAVAGGALFVAALVLQATGTPHGNGVVSSAGWLFRIAALILSAVAGVMIYTLTIRRSDGLACALRELTDDHEPYLDRGAEAAIDTLKRRLNELRQEKRRAETVLANMADGIIVVDSECTITLINRAAERIFNRKAAEVQGRTLQDADLHPEVARAAAECLAGRGEQTAEIRLPGLPERTVAIRAFQFEGGDECAMIIVRDISDVRRHEKNQREFVSNVSHELKTPITSVRVTAEALLGGARNDEQLVVRFLNNIVSESDRLSALIEDLLDIARRDSGMTALEVSEADVREMLERATAPVRPRAENGGITLTVEAPEGLTFRCDQLQVEQMIRNLADNAVKYTSSGGRVDVRATESDGSLVITVSDTGIGIPQGELHRIFDRFYRVDKARSRRLGGTGLGLSIVKEIVDAHGGEINVDSELGKGSTFTVRLPAQPHQQDNRASGTHYLRR